MAGVEAKIMQNPSLKTYKCSLGCQIKLRLLASVASLAAVWIMFTSNQSLVLYGIHIDAKYSDSSAFKFFAVANLIACSFSVNSLFVAVILARKCSNPNKYFYLFLHDLIVMTLVMAACAAATAIGVVARNGNVHTGWIAICDNFVRFCHRLTISVTFSYVALVLYLFLTIISAKKFRKSPLDEENGGGGGSSCGEMSNF